MRSHTLLGVIIILIGLSILFHFAIFNFLFAFVILWIGVKILTGQSEMFGSIASATKGVLNEDSINRVLVFSGIKTKLKTENFQGMDVVTIFGGLKLIVPKGWQVKSEGVGIIGGFNNSTDSPVKSGVTVHLKGAAIFGGVEVAN